MTHQQAVEHWAQVDRLLDRVLALPMTDRTAFVQQQSTDNPRVRDEVLALLAELGTRGDLLDRPALEALPRSALPPDLQPGHRVGAYRLLALLGRGGMGEVYRAERADDQFDHEVAVKLLRQDAVEHLGLFVSERRILARLEHPGIARLYDAGVADDGRPYMVMELVEGVPITDWCKQRKAGLEQRLALFTQVCDAIAYAHQNLVIHRDLKPGNILVTGDGRVKLLDFGVAKLLSGTVEDATRNTPMTLSYAAPEQLTRTAMSTATDIYALGVLLFELLTDRLPWATAQIPIATAIEKVLHETAPVPSTFAAGTPSPPVSARLLSGDLDAIVGKAMRKGPAERYATVVGLQVDVRRHIQGDPVLARERARLYVFNCFMRRYRWPAAGIAVLIVTLATGFASTTWQARRAEVQAMRATATKDFLISIFLASDPRIASDKSREEITAKELLDIGAARIEKDFVGQPALQIELLGVTADIYEQLLDEEHFLVLQKRRMKLARQHYGPDHPIVIEALLSEVVGKTYRQDYVEADQLLGEVDTLLKKSGQDRTVLRAEWLRLKAQLLYGSGGNIDEMTRALDQSIALYEQLEPQSKVYANVLSTAANVYNERGDFVQQRRYNERALAIYDTSPGYNDGAHAIVLNSYARNLETLGEFAAAQNAYKRAEDLARKTYGKQDEKYWLALAYHARMLHRQGDRERAHELFRHMLEEIPSDWKTNNKDAWARGLYAGCLVAEGRASDAIPLLEDTLDSFVVRDYSASVPVWRLALGDAYDVAGRTDAARVMLNAALEETLKQEGSTSVYAPIYRERWGRFLLDHAKSGNLDLAAAEVEFRKVIEKPSTPLWLDLPLAHAGLARINLARGDITGAINSSRSALATLEQVQGVYDLRVKPRLWLVHSSVLLKSGDGAGSLRWANMALEASRRYDAPTSPAIADAEAAVRIATAASN